MRPGAARAAVAATVLGLVAAAIALWPGTDAPRVDPPGATTGSSATATVAARVDTGIPEPEVRSQAVTILSRRNLAVRNRNLAAWLADLAPGPRLRAREHLAFKALTRIPFERFSMRLDGELEASDGAGAASWEGRLIVTAKIRGYDPTAGTYQRPVRFVAREGRLRLAATTPPDSGAQPWEIGLADVTSGRRSLVVGAGPDRRLEEVAGSTDLAVEQVSDVWGRDWSRRVVVYLPRSQREMAAMLGGNGRVLDQIAAVSSTLESPSGRPGPTRVVVNPATTKNLAGVGLAALLRHEITHVATGTGQNRVPIWLSEGFADYVAYRGLGLDASSVAADLIRDAASNGAPRRLPDRAAFAPTSARLAQAYQGSWLAVQLLAEEHGEKAVVRLYRATQRRGIESALRTELATTASALLADWRAAINRLADG